tara:strand:+ start:633 stop:776 length:144 start_codon:yes stop_codon:yes gene_type:complete
MKNRFYQRFLEKIKIKKFDQNQPLRIWVFVIFLNFIGLLGYIFINKP